jgi:hypothetical protein
MIGGMIGVVFLGFVQNAKKRAMPFGEVNTGLFPGWKTASFERRRQSKIVGMRRGALGGLERGDF